jgi:hypothetical protein
MRNRTTVGVGVVLAVIMFPLLAAGNPDTYLVPDPPLVDFGEVEVGSSRDMVVRLWNSNGHNIIVSIIDIQVSHGGDFLAQHSPLPIEIGILGSTYVRVTFAPLYKGVHSASLLVTSSADNGLLRVELKGVGTEPEPEVSIDTILAFFYEGVDNGWIVGVGPNCSSQRAHLKVFEMKLLMVKFFINKEWCKGACKLLWHAYARSDDQKPPKDWIKDGEGAEGTVLELNNMILQLLSNMGCM